MADQTDRDLDAMLVGIVVIAVGMAVLVGLLLWKAASG